MKITRVTKTMPLGVVLKIETSKKLRTGTDRMLLLDSLIERTFPGWGRFGFARLEDVTPIDANASVTLTFDVIGGKEAEFAEILRAMADELVK